jgi:hypothetical protein
MDSVARAKAKHESPTIHRHLTTKFAPVLLGEQRGEIIVTWPIDRKVVGAFGVALLSVGLLGALAYTSMTKFMKSNRSND